MDYLGTRTTAGGNVVHSFVNYGDKAASAASQGVVGADYVDKLMTQARANASANMAWSASQAANQMNFQRQMQQDAMDFNASEAAKNRDWQQYMSSTAHQREVADLKAAGLNPVLSASGGNGAAVTSGATAAGVQGASGASGQIDNSANSTIASILGSWISSLTALENQRNSAASNEAIADKYNAMTKYVEEIRDVREREIASAQLTYNYWQTGVIDAMNRYMSDNSLKSSQALAAAQKASAAIHADAQKYSADKSYSIAELQANTQKDLQEAGFSHDQAMAIVDFAIDDVLQSKKHTYTMEENRASNSQKHKYAMEEIGLQGKYGLGREAISQVGGLLRDLTRPYAWADAYR